MVFDPLLAEVAAAMVEPKDMAATLRELLKGVRCRTEEVLDIDLNRKIVQYESDEAGLGELEFDQLVIAAGNTSNLAMVPGMADHAFPMKSVGDALAIQSHVINQLERAEVCADAERQKKYLSFIVVGGGFSGVEIAGELNDLVKRSTQYYPNFSAADVSITLVHSHDHILPEVSPSLRAFALEKMKERGINFKLKSHAVYCTSDGVGLDSGEFLTGATVVCTIGVRTLPMIEKLPLKKEKGRLVTNPDMSLPGYDCVWAIGDCASILNGYDNQISPTTGQFAERQGAQVAANIAARLKNQPTKAFYHKSLGTLCSIGGKSAVAEMMGIKISGLLAWMAWRGVYLMKLPSFPQKIKVGLDWAFDLLFPPPLTTVRSDRSKRVGRAHYKAGNVIYHMGDPTAEFYVVEDGEIEIFLDVDSRQHVLAVLGKGDFFGEGALKNGEKRRHSSRARVDSEVLILGKNVFSEISEHLAPFRSALADAMKRRNFNWQEQGEAPSMLQSLSMPALLERAEERTVHPGDKLLSVIRKINDMRLDFCYVVDDAFHLKGLVTRSDLIRALEVAATLQAKSQFDLEIKEIMMPKPVFCTDTDSLSVAVGIMREHGYSRLPVVDSKDHCTLKGYLRLENIMCELGKELAPDMMEVPTKLEAMAQNADSKNEPCVMGLNANL
jgi:NADH dehydrogenase